MFLSLSSCWDLLNGLGWVKSIPNSKWSGWPRASCSATLTLVSLLPFWDLHMLLPHKMWHSVTRSNNLNCWLVNYISGQHIIFRQNSFGVWNCLCAYKGLGIFLGCNGIQKIPPEKCCKCTSAFFYHWCLRNGCHHSGSFGKWFPFS